MKRAIVLALFVLSGCRPESRVHEVMMRNFRFDPETVSVAAGDSVRWRNADLVPHTATSDRGEWDSGSINAGEVRQLPFSAPGTHTYLCTLHPTMRGVVVVR